MSLQPPGGIQGQPRSISHNKGATRLARRVPYTLCALGFTSSRQISHDAQTSKQAHQQLPHPYLQIWLSKTHTLTPPAHYWPKGWSWHCYRQATDDDLNSVQETEPVKVQAGLPEVLGEDGVKRLSEYPFQGEQARAKANRNPNPAQTESATRSPDWLEQWRKRHRGQPWGSVMFHTAMHGGSDQENTWQAFQERFDTVIDASFVPVSQENGEDQLPRELRRGKGEIRDPLDPEKGTRQRLR